MARFGMDGYVRPPLSSSARRADARARIDPDRPVRGARSFCHRLFLEQRAKRPRARSRALEPSHRQRRDPVKTGYFRLHCAACQRLSDARRGGRTANPSDLTRAPMTRFVPCFPPQKRGATTPSSRAAISIWTKRRALFKEEQHRLRAQGQSAAHRGVCGRLRKRLGRPAPRNIRSGLSVEICASAVGTTSGFESNPVYDWLSKNAWRYGFVLRYPEDKTDVTGHRVRSLLLSLRRRFAGTADAQKELLFGRICR